MERFNPCTTEACKKQCDSMGVHCKEICIDEIERLRCQVAKWMSLADANAAVAEACQRRHERDERLGTMPNA